MNKHRTLRILFIVFFLTLFSFYVSLSYNKTRLTRDSLRSKNVTSPILNPVNLKARPARIFCIILSSDKSYKERARSVYHTWATKCDNFKFVLKLTTSIVALSTNKTKPDLSDILEPDGIEPDNYFKLTDKVLLTFKHLYNSPGYNSYDWYLKADDDTFIFVDNLRSFVADKNASLPVTYGYDFNCSTVEGGYHSGGGSYLLSNEAVTRLGRQLTKNNSFCENSGVEDRDVAKCLRKVQVYPNKSIDELGRERFHPMSMIYHYKGYFPYWMYKLSSNPVRSGPGCCSTTSISKI